jgi:hypothetical protein
VLLRVIAVLLLLSSCRAPTAAEGAPTLLESAVENWLGERDHWAFTQRAVEYDHGVAHERLERYDPSRPDEARWTLLAVDGQPPTPEQRAAWAKKKFKKNRRRFDAPIGDYFDFARARVVEETPRIVRYQVPLRSDKSWLFPVDKVIVRVTVNKETRALEHLSADVREPFKVLLGLAKITDGELDLAFLAPDAEAGGAPEAAQPTGTARVTVSKFGERAEFTWSDFKRVVPVK